MGGEAGGETPGGDAGPDLADLQAAVHIDKVDGELHPEGVDGFAGDDPEATAGGQAGTSEKTFATLAARDRSGIDGGTEDGLPGEIFDLHGIIVRRRNRQ